MSASSITKQITCVGSIRRYLRRMSASLPGVPMTSCSVKRMLGLAKKRDCLVRIKIVEFGGFYVRIGTV